MMSLRMSQNLSLLILIFISGAVTQDEWRVNYNPKSICALNGSKVNIFCSYSAPSGQKFKKALWSKIPSVDVEPPDLLDDPEYRGRVKYLIDERGDCSFRLSDVREKDQRTYYFRFITDQPGGKYQDKGGVDLSLTDLQVEVPERVIEGDKVTLTCRTTCRLSKTPTFTWYRNGTPSSETDPFHLQSVSREDAGRYHCGELKERVNSPEVTLNVRYPPENVQIINHHGLKVSLTCSSDANPPVQNYTWYMKGESSPVGSGKSYWSVWSGFYICEARNEHGSQKSEEVYATAKGFWILVSVLIIAAVLGVCLIAYFIWIKKFSSSNPFRQKQKPQLREMQHLGAA